MQARFFMAHRLYLRQTGLKIGEYYAAFSNAGSGTHSLVADNLVRDVCTPHPGDE
jgi:hypothetical protein